MGRFCLSILMIVSCIAGSAEETLKKTKKCRTSSGYSSREATVLSMMGWGIGIFAGIATLFALLDSNPEQN